MPTSHTPTSHGTWRVIDGQLVDESTLPLPDAPANPPLPPVTPAPKSTRRNAPTQPE